MSKKVFLPFLLLPLVLLSACPPLTINIGDSPSSTNTSPSGSSASKTPDNTNTSKPSNFSKEGLIAYYPFNGNANDESGNGYNGVVHSADLTSDKSGNNNSAYKFNGKNSYIEVPNISSDLFGRDYSISVWVRFDDFKNDYPHIICGQDNFITLHGKGPAYGSNIGQVAFYQDNFIKDNSRRLIPEINTKDKLKTSSFHNIVFVKKALSTYMYLDGVLKNTGGTNVGELVKGTGLYIGTGFLKEENQSMNGVVDDLMIYNRALEDKEISDISNGNIISSPDDLKPSETPKPSNSVLPTPTVTSTPDTTSNTGIKYKLVKHEVEVSFSPFKPDGIHWAEPAREKFYYKGSYQNLKLPPYDPLIGLKRLLLDEVSVEWKYDENKKYKVDASWTPPPQFVYDGKLLGLEERISLAERVGPFVEGNINARVHFGESNYYYLVTGDGEYGSDQNVIWDGTKIGESIIKQFDIPLKVSGNDEFAINIFYVWSNNSVGWWYYYKKDTSN